MKIAKLNWIEIKGFRSFGPEPQRIELSPTFTLIRAENSQGKTSFSEAVEFLLAGSTSRRNLHTGSKTEFEGSLKNVHMDSSEDVWVRAELMFDDGSTGILQRKLVGDYDGASECTSELTLDGRAITDIESLGFKLAGHSLAAPVLEQHVLRYVSSAAPQERADYFKALMDLSDLEEVRSILTEYHSSLTAFESTILSRLLRLAMDQKYSTTVRDALSSQSYEDLERSLIELGNTALAEAGVNDSLETLAEIQSKLT